MIRSLRRGGGPRSRLLLALPLALGTALLVAFHAILFWQRLADLTLFEPVVALRWAAALGLAGLFECLRRRRIPLFWGPRALAIWLLVLLLHVSFPGIPALGLASRLGPVTPAVLGLVLGWSLAYALLASAGAGRTTAPAFFAARRLPPVRRRAAPFFFSALFCRPPPA